MLGVVILAPVLTTIDAAPFAVASFVKRERPLWCSLIAAAISIGPTVFLAGSMITKKLDDDAHQNRTFTGETGVDPAQDPPLRGGVAEPASAATNGGSLAASEPRQARSEELTTVHAGTELFPPPMIPRSRPRPTET